MSPLGGQATLRILDTELRPVIFWAEVQYISTRSHLEFQGADTDKSFSAILRGMYFSSLMSPNTVKNSSLDLWGNVKIPYLISDDVEWADVPEQLDPSLYSSILGVPLFNIPLGNVIFSMESTYLQLQYTTPQNGGPREQIPLNETSHGAKNGTFQGISFQNRSDESTWSLGMDNFAGGYYWGGPRDFPNTHHRHQTRDSPIPRLPPHDRSISKCQYTRQVFRYAEIHRVSRLMQQDSLLSKLLGDRATQIFTAAPR
jgi:hypothetical protein